MESVRIENHKVPSTDQQTDGACAAKVTTLLNEVGAGNAQAADALLPLVYEQLRALAGRKMRQERPDQTLQATALVHEAYLRLVDTTKVQLWENRWHFFAAAADAMRRILIENARRRGRLKRGGNLHRIDLDKLELSLDGRPDQILALDAALLALAEKHPQKARLVTLRFFGGLTREEVAQALGLSTATADRHWSYARAWLYDHIATGQR
jgi:RNA polymerase sigma factor (TIGR02999 family)